MRRETRSEEVGLGEERERERASTGTSGSSTSTHGNDVCDVTQRRRWLLWRRAAPARDIITWHTTSHLASSYAHSSLRRAAYNYSTSRHHYHYHHHHQCIPTCAQHCAMQQALWCVSAIFNERHVSKVREQDKQVLSWICCHIWSLINYIARLLLLVTKRRLLFLQRAARFHLMQLNDHLNMFVIFIHPLYTLSRRCVFS